MRRIIITPGTEKSTYRITYDALVAKWTSEQENTIDNDEMIYRIYTAPAPLQTKLTVDLRKVLNKRAIVWAGQFIEAADSVGMVTEVLYK